MSNEPVREPWYNDRDMIMKIVLLLTMVVNLLQSYLNAGKAEKIESNQQVNSKKIDKIHKDVKVGNAQMGIPEAKEE